MKPEGDLLSQMCAEYTKTPRPLLRLRIWNIRNGFIVTYAMVAALGALVAYLAYLVL